MQRLTQLNKRSIMRYFKKKMEYNVSMTTKSVYVSICLDFKVYEKLVPGYRKLFYYIGEILTSVITTHFEEWS